MIDKPLMVQSDKTMLLDVHSPSFEECRNDIIAFADLVKSPEHIHTYTLSPLTLWNAVSSGLDSNEIISRLKKWSRYEIDERVIFFIEDTASRYGEFILTEEDQDNLRLSVKRERFFLTLFSEPTLKKYLRKGDGNYFLISKLDRGTVKAKMVKMGFPVDDRIPLKKGSKLEFDLKDNVEIRDYQKESVDAFLSSGGYGTIVLPCGSGKTIVGIETAVTLKTNTLILCPNVSSVHQWIRELLDKTTLTPDQIGEYSGETKTIKPVTVCTYQVLTYRTKNFDKEETEPIYPHFSIFSENNWGLVIYDEVHMLPAPVFRITAELQSIYRLGLTATLIREDGREDEVFSLVGPKRFDTPWAELTQKGFIAKAYCHEVRIPLPHTLELEYALAPKKEKYRIASQNPLKIKVAEAILKKHEGESILIIGQYLEQLQVFRDHFGYPIITGTTSNKKRDELYDKFRSGEEKVMIVSKVANFAVDLPDASVAIEISGSFGSRQEEAQRLGRILRPKARDSHFYTIVTEYSQEEEFASNRQKFLSEQGYSYSIIKEDVR
ncbi:MAG: helicase-associated domain-containing protein [Spirochaetales bacterium]|nr:helicase-associated domain-containing protein [Spirochaetales bacterium]